jgi:hypothetical protein
MNLLQTQRVAVTLATTEMMAKMPQNAQYD